MALALAVLAVAEAGLQVPVLAVAGGAQLAVLALAGAVPVVALAVPVRLAAEEEAEALVDLLSSQSFSAAMARTTP